MKKILWPLLLACCFCRASFGETAGFVCGDYRTFQFNRLAIVKDGDDLLVRMRSLEGATELNLSRVSSRLGVATPKGMVEILFRIPAAKVKVTRSGYYVSTSWIPEVIIEIRDGFGYLLAQRRVKLSFSVTHKILEIGQQIAIPELKIVENGNFISATYQIHTDKGCLVSL